MNLLILKSQLRLGFFLRASAHDIGVEIERTFKKDEYRY